jgi:hypothetical protein
VRSFAFPGTFEDHDGAETLTWQIRSSDRPGWGGRYEIRTRIRSVDVWGADFDGLEPDDAGAADGGVLPINSAGELTRCLLTGDLPCTVEVAGQRRPTRVHFELDLREHSDRPAHNPKNLLLSTILDDTTYAITDDWFEDGTLRIDDALRPSRLVCCVTCLYSDYSPGGHGLMGMSCHRDAKDQYLAVRSKADYWHVPVTEDVPETYLCEEYKRRIPGTGYRG